MPKVVDGPGIYIAQADTSVTADPTASGATNNGQ